MYTYMPLCAYIHTYIHIHKRKCIYKERHTDAEKENTHPEHSPNIKLSLKKWIPYYRQQRFAICTFYEQLILNLLRDQSRDS